MITLPPDSPLTGYLAADPRGGAGAGYDRLGGGCGLLCAPWERLLCVEGSEAAEFLQAMLTQDLAGISSGETRPAALADRRGHWLGDLWVHRDGERFLLRLRADRAAVVLDLFQRHRFSSRVAWRDASTGARPLLLLGPGARRVLRGLGVDDGGGARQGGRLSPAAEGTWIGVREVGAEDVALFPSTADEPELRARLTAVGGLEGEIGAAAFHARRIEAGTPWHGLDGDESNLCSECVPADRISFTKGCFLGQETLARVQYRGRLRRRLERLVVEADAPLSWGEEILGEDGGMAGVLRSAARRPDGSAVAFALRERGARGSLVRLRGGARGRWWDEAPIDPVPSS